MNSTASVISAMNKQKKEMNEKLAEVMEEKEKWKKEYLSLSEKMINSPLSSPPQGRRKAASSVSEWEGLPEIWTNVAQNSLRAHIKKKVSQHVRQSYVSPQNLNVIVQDVADHAQEIFEHMLSATANSSLGSQASEDNIKKLCHAVLHSLAMERELYPLITMYITYAAESCHVTNRDREEEEEEEKHSNFAGSLKESLYNSAMESLMTD